jgi:hypothetical protein
MVELLLIMMGKAVSKSTTIPSQPLFKGKFFLKNKIIKDDFASSESPEVRIKH